MPISGATERRATLHAWPATVGAQLAAKCSKGMAGVRNARPIPQVSSPAATVEISPTPPTRCRVWG
ncbi:hypothetical protein MAHJHV63_50910 [Mycobacterium avium subsp. hominissuis]